MRAPGDRIGPRGQSSVAPGASGTEESCKRSDAPDLRDGEIGGFRCAGRAGAGAGPSTRPRHPLNNFAAVLGGGGGQGQAGFTCERIGARRCGLQVPEVVTGVRLDGVRGVVVVRDPAEQVEQFSRRQGDRLAGVVMGHVHIVTEGAADRDGGSSSGGPWPLRTRPYLSLPCGLATPGRTSGAASAPPVPRRSRAALRPLDDEKWPGLLYGWANDVTDDGAPFGGW